MLETIDLRPGIYKNGTPHSRRLRWDDGNQIRWHDGAIRPIGGWQRRTDSSSVEIPALVTDASVEAIRDAFTWRSNNQNQNLVLGSNSNLYYVGPTGAVTNITYTGFTPNNSSKDATNVAGYGIGPYGIGAYGATNNLAGEDPTPPDRWYTTAFGELLLTGVRRNGGVYEVDPATLTPVAVANAPSNNQALIVTEERQVMAVGANGEPRRIQISDIENRTSWTPAETNQVVDRTLAGNGRLLNVANISREVVIVGETDAVVGRYIGPPYVWSFDVIANQCGIIAAEALVATDSFAVWWGDRKFWRYHGSLETIKCDVIDFLAVDVDPIQVSKITGFTNSDFNEVWWLYQSQNSSTGEVDSYVVWNYVDKTWLTGRIDRTAGIDKGTLQTPLMVTSGGLLYNHELSDVLPMGEGDVYVQSGSILLGKGDKNMAVRYIYPDSEAIGDVSFTLIGKQMPNDTEYTYGPYAFNNPVPTRAIGRSIRLRSDFLAVRGELGSVRLDYAPIGTGKR